MLFYFPLTVKKTEPVYVLMPKSYIWVRNVRMCITILEWSEITYQTSGKTEPLPEQGRSHRAGLPQKTARTRSWRPEKRENFRSGRPWLLLTASLNVTYLHVSFSRNVVFEVFHGAHQEGNVAGQHLEKRTHLWLELIWATTSSNKGIVNHIFCFFYSTSLHSNAVFYFFLQTLSCSFPYNKTRQ